MNLHSISPTYQPKLSLQITPEQHRMKLIRIIVLASKVGSTESMLRFIHNLEMCETGECYCLGWPLTESNHYNAYVSVTECGFSI